MDSLRDRLLEKFASIPQDRQTPVWDQVWQEGVTPWDRNAPSPALREALDQNADLLKLSRNRDSNTRPRALVPGCGKGYDVALLASYGFDAYGLDVSPTALSKAKQYLADDALLEESYPVTIPGAGRGKMEFLLGDFFGDDILAALGGSKFDLLYDYTFLCALPPEMRPKWAKSMRDMLASNGRLVCLEFPLHKDPATPGPPHGLTAELYEELFKAPGEAVEYSSDGRVKSRPTLGNSTGGLVKCTRWKPEKSHAAGQGSDHVSIWKHV